MPIDPERIRSDHSGRLEPIERADLRTECIRCGGVGRRRISALDGSGKATTSKVIPCMQCLGRGRYVPKTIKAR